MDKIVTQSSRALTLSCVLKNVELRGTEREYILQVKNLSGNSLTRYQRKELRGTERQYILQVKDLSGSNLTAYQRKNRSNATRKIMFSQGLSKCTDFIVNVFSRHDPTSEEVTPASILEGVVDTYDGITVDPGSLPTDPVSFRNSLRASLNEWKSKGLRGVWLKLMLNNAPLIPVAIEEGFIFHHAEPEYAMLTKWLPDTPSTLPENASHVVGVGGIVVKDKKEILVLQERTGPTKDSGVWKMPTGVIHMGEDIKTAVVREVKEETGLETEFVEILGVRQSHNAAFGKSDLFFLCLLKPLTVEIINDEREIKAAKWISLEEYRNQPFNAQSSMLTRISDIVNASLDERYTGFQPELLSFGFRKKGRYFYHNKKDIDAYLGTTSSSTDTNT